MTQMVDETRLEQFLGQMAGYMTGGAMCVGVWLGDRSVGDHQPDFVDNEAHPS